MTQKELFTEFINFRWGDRSEAGINTEVPTKDIILGELTIARLNNKGCTIHYLSNGNSVCIPQIWIDIFTSFNVYSGAQVIHIGKGLDRVDNVIYYMLLLVVSLDLKRGDEFLEILGKLSEIKTIDFREWVEEKFNINLRPIQFSGIVDSSFLKLSIDI